MPVPQWKICLKKVIVDLDYTLKLDQNNLKVHIQASYSEVSVTIVNNNLGISRKI